MTADELAALVRSDHAAAAPLYAVDPARARALHLHRKPETRALIAADLRAHDLGGLAALVALLLEDDDREVLEFALAEAATLPPALVPVDLARALAGIPLRELRLGAAQVLAAVRLPEDAARVLEALLAEELAPARDVLAWLAPLPDSDRLLAVVDDGAIAPLMRRRRCAGLATDPGPARRALADASTPATRQRALREELGELPPPPAWLDEADAAFRSGALDPGAHAIYARVLLGEPTSALAAVQLAVIDRLHGRPISEARIAWLHQLGAHDRALLDELARPIAPWDAAGEAAISDPAAHLARVRLACTPSEG